MRNEARGFDRVVAVVLTTVMASYSMPVMASSGATPRPAEIRGSILSSDGLTAVAGASVKAANMETKEIFTSSKTAADGRYSLTGLPAGSYDLAVETGTELFAADVLIEAHPGQRALVSLALKPAASVQQGQPEGEKEGEKEPEQGASDDDKDAKKDEGKKEEPAAQPEPTQQKKKKKGQGFWRSPGGAAVAIIIGAGLLGVAANSAADDSQDDEPPITQSSTSNVPN